MTIGLMKSMKFRDKQYKKLKSINPLTLEYNMLETSFKCFCSILQKSIRLAKASFYHDQFEKYKSDIRKTWSKINELITKRAKSL